jgi:CheY-like chemotaxis protein
LPLKGFVSQEATISGSLQIHAATKRRFAPCPPRPHNAIISGMTNNSASPGDGLPPRILIVDDSAEQRSALAQILQDAGYVVDEAADGDSAILFLQNRPPDLLLLDLQMPGTDGFAVLAHLQRSPVHIPAILLSGLGPDEIQHSMHRLPARSLPPLLFKPVDTDQLLSVIGLKLGGELPA